MIVVYIAAVLAIIELATADSTFITQRSRVNQCLKDYIPKLEAFGLDSRYLEELRKIDSDSETPKPATTRIVLDIGLGSMWHSDVFRHMVALNISGLDNHHKSSFNCQYESTPRNNTHAFRSSMYDSNPPYVYAAGNNPGLPVGGATWWRILGSTSDTMVLMNDVSDEEYFNNQNTAMCNPEWQKNLPLHCFVPLVSVSAHMNTTTAGHRLSRFTFDQVKVMLSAYRELIKCIVPPENLFQFNLNQMPSVEYWSKLTSFLNIGLPASGVKYLSEGGSVCDSEKQHTDARHVKRVQCADDYGASIAAIFGAQFKSLARNMLLQSVYAPRRAPEDTDRLILGIGPGSTGTRTVFFSTSQLNLTGMHYQSLSGRPGFKKWLKRGDFDYDMTVLEKDTQGGRVIWLDTPMANRWWYLYKMYPNSNFLVTDIRNDTKWFEKRYSYHCAHTKIRTNDPSCIAPMAIRCDRNPLSFDLFRAAQLKVANVTTAIRTFEAYRALIRCVIPSDKVWWIYLSELKSSEGYWTKLIALSKSDISPEKKELFIARGIPRCGSSGCYWNETKYKRTEMEVTKVGIVGATGAVGMEIVLCLKKIGVPKDRIQLFASSSSAGKIFQIDNYGEFIVKQYSIDEARTCDVLFLAVSAKFSEDNVPDLLEAGGPIVIDNSSAFRYYPHIPLVVPEINFSSVGANKLIANPNCTTAIAAVVLWPIHQQFGIKRVIMSTYQAASGAGAEGMQELLQGTESYLRGDPPVKHSVFPHPLPFNVIPHIDTLQISGYTREEMKVVWELNKIFGVGGEGGSEVLMEEGMKISVTAVRVPTLRAHAEAITLETVKPITVEAVRSLLAEAPGVRLVDDPDHLQYPMPLTATHCSDVEVGRIRQSLVFENGIDLFICGDQLLRGAAWNAVMIAQKLFEKKIAG